MQERTMSDTRAWIDGFLCGFGAACAAVVWMAQKEQEPALIDENGNVYPLK